MTYPGQVLYLSILALFGAFLAYALLRSRYSFRISLFNSCPWALRHLLITGLVFGASALLRWLALSLRFDQSLPLLATQIILLTLLLALYTIGLGIITYRGRDFLSKQQVYSFKHSYRYAISAILIGTIIMIAGLVSRELLIKLLMQTNRPSIGWNWYVVPLIYELFFGALFAVPVALLMKKKHRPHAEK